MGLTMNEKQAVGKQLALEYKRVTKRNKGRILDSLLQLAQYNRSYAARVLRHPVTATILARGTAARVQITVVEYERSAGTSHATGRGGAVRMSLSRCRGSG